MLNWMVSYFVLKGIFWFGFGIGGGEGGILTEGVVCLVGFVAGYVGVDGGVGLEVFVVDEAL